MSNGDLASATSASTDTKPVDTRKLLRALVELFDENDLRDLCFELSVDYENLPPGGKKDKARELIIYFNRRRRLNVLIAAFREQRPHVIWDDIVLDEADEDPLLSTTAILPNLSASTQDKTNTFLAGKSFTALIRVLSRPEVNTAVVAFRTDFQAASEQIDVMNDYKLVHDLFQELENRFFLIYNDQRRLPADDTAWDSIAINEPELQGKIADLLNVAQRPTFVNQETHWVQQLSQVQVLIRQAVEEYDLKQLKAGTHVLSRVLNLQPSLINAQLVATAKALRLDALEKAMTTTSNSLAESDLAMESIVDEVKSGVVGLAGLDARLKSLVREHDIWQALDVELHRVETGLLQGIEELEVSWYDLDLRLRNLCNGRMEEWATELTTVAEALQKALADQVIVTVRRLFRRFRSQAGRRFRQVDLELLTLCQELQKVGESLDLLLRNFK